MAGRFAVSPSLGFQGGRGRGCVEGAQVSICSRAHYAVSGFLRISSSSGLNTTSWATVPNHLTNETGNNVKKSQNSMHKRVMVSKFYIFRTLSKTKRSALAQKI